MKKFKTLFFICTVLLSCTNTTTSFEAEGYVFDKSIKSPIADANVSILCNDHSISTNTNSIGYFSLSLNIAPDSANVAVVIISKSGYKPYSKEIVHLYVGGSVDDTFYLESTN